MIQLIEDVNTVYVLHLILELIVLLKIFII